MQVTKIAATTRKDNGKGACRRLRAQGQMPAITYGSGVAPVSLTVSPDAVASILTSEKGTNTLFDLEIDGSAVKAMITEYQYHPLTRKLLHADFIQVKAEQKIDTKVPLSFFGKSRGVVMGGKLRQVFRELPIRCAASLIPTGIAHDITDLELDQALHVGDLDLPEGVEVLMPEKQTVAVVATDRRAKTDAEAAEGEK